MSIMLGRKFTKNKKTIYYSKIWLNFCLFNLIIEGLVYKYSKGKIVHPPYLIGLSLDTQLEKRKISKKLKLLNIT